MWKLEIEFNGISNMKKHNIMFVFIPTVVYMTSLYNKKTSHSLAIAWLVIDLTFELKFK